MHCSMASINCKRNTQLLQIAGQQGGKEARETIRVGKLTGMESPIAYTVLGLNEKVNGGIH